MRHENSIGDLPGLFTTFAGLKKNSAYDQDTNGLKVRVQRFSFISLSVSKPYRFQAVCKRNALGGQAVAVFRANARAVAIR
ncbi:hypothetical protein OH492_17975 [Vibrio chagasii]|nr:hypothetical protein [Vibrio chagasii]